MQAGSRLLTWWLVTISSCHTILVVVFAHLNCTLCWNSFLTLQGMDTIMSQGTFLKVWQSVLKSAFFFFFLERLQWKWSLENIEVEHVVGFSVHLIKENWKFYTFFFFVSKNLAHFSWSYALRWKFLLWVVEVKRGLRATSVLRSPC